jgi:hypothetical protein
MIGTRAASVSAGSAGVAALSGAADPQQAGLFRTECVNAELVAHIAGGAGRNVE